MRQRAPVALDNSDLLLITDQLTNLNSGAMDVLLETGGGSVETVEDIVRLSSAESARCQLMIVRQFTVCVSVADVLPTSCTLPE